MPLDRTETHTLIEAARAVHGEFTLTDEFSAGSCAAAVRAIDGRIFTGICLDLACGIGFCAEHAAVAEMLKARQTRIVAVAAVGADTIMPPCGRCRELMAQIDPGNLDAHVAVDFDRIARLRELLPDHWLLDS